MSKFITNKKKLLQEVVKNILPSTDNLRFLVGYFYFSGFRGLVEELEDKNIRILVGMEAERELLGKVRQYFDMEGAETISRQGMKDKFYQNFTNLFNNTDFFDSPEKLDAFRVYIEKIKEGSLEIRKTRHPNHAKLYLFENLPEHSEGGEYPGIIITGSSNLTYSGLQGGQEMNVQLRESDAYLEAKELFDTLWDNAVVLADKDHIEEFEEKVISRVWFDKLYSPYLMYIRVLEEYFSFTDDKPLRLPAEMTDNRYLNFQYQIDAIKQGREALRKHNGVILADVVGLGKSIIASAIAHDYGLETIIISPPHLKRQWKDYTYDFNLQAKIYSTHVTKIEEALEEVRGESNDSQKLVIVDEAHRFRNEESSSYRALHELCQNNKVILLTATPFNNEPQDIFAMVKLFQVPAKSTLQTVDNLSYQFRRLIKEYKKIRRDQRDQSSGEKDVKKKIDKIAQHIRLMIEPVVIRRTRIDLEKIPRYKKDLDKLGIEVQRPEPPSLLQYDLEDIKPLYSATLEKIVPDSNEQEGYQATRYMPLAYVKEKYRDKVQEEFGEERIDVVAQKNVAAFMKRLLVRRFESSIPSFRSTLDNLIQSTQNIKQWYEYHSKVPVFKKGEVPDLSEEVVNSWDEDEIRLYFDNIDPREEYEKEIAKGMHVINAEYLNESFKKDLEDDLKLLKEIKQNWEENVTTDPKLDYFTEQLEKTLEEDPNRKVVVFSEFADTVNYLYTQLKENFNVMRYTGGGATKSKKRQLRKNFDASIPLKQQSNKFNVLITTDSISEGYSLHRAGVIFNYDIPYNPTRVIQRIGRLNRISKKTFDNIYVYNFFPSLIGEKETRTKAISTLKMQMVHTLLGEDVQALTPDEKINSVFHKQYKQVIDAEEKESWDTSYRKDLENIKQLEQESFESAMAIPPRSKILRSKKFNKSGVIVFAEKGEEYKFMFAQGTEKENQTPISPEKALSIFKAEKSEEPKEPSESFDPIYQSLKKNLFERKTDYPRSRSVNQAINQLEYLLEHAEKEKDYLKDLHTVIKELDGLSKAHVKQLKNINVSNVEKAIDELKERITPSHLQAIIRASKKVDEGDEKLIFSQEIREE